MPLPRQRRVAALLETYLGCGLDKVEPETALSMRRARGFAMTIGASIFWTGVAVLGVGYAVLASHDALTDLLNRRAFGERLEQAIARARRHTRRVGLIFLDLDDFSGLLPGRG